jgi:hypothetical protein
MLSHCDTSDKSSLANPRKVKPPTNQQRAILIRAENKTTDQVSNRDANASARAWIRNKISNRIEKKQDIRHDCRVYAINSKIAEA